jgi:hypothetical protein
VFDGQAPPVFEVMAAQLHNHILDQIPYRYCANEACGVRFVRQRGRARPGGGHSDAQYCMTACAKAQTQRERRRRARREKLNG